MPGASNVAASPMGSGYSVTPAIPTFGATEREAVLIEWTDTNISNATFEGTARELMRLQYSGRIHPMGDLIFNPAARPGDPDWRVMYIAAGDGGNGEQRSSVRSNPQRLDTLVGKILRIIPGVNEHADRSTLSVCGGNFRWLAISRPSMSRSSRVGRPPRHRRYAASSKLTRPASSSSS